MSKVLVTLDKIKALLQAETRTIYLQKKIALNRKKIGAPKWLLRASGARHMHHGYGVSCRICPALPCLRPYALLLLLLHLHSKIWVLIDHTRAYGNWDAVLQNHFARYFHPHHHCFCAANAKGSLVFPVFAHTRPAFLPVKSVLSANTRI